MAGMHRRQNTVLNQLIQAPQQFEFFQALHLLHLGFAQEQCRYRVSTGSSFPVAGIDRIEAVKDKVHGMTLQIGVTCFGLIGQAGVLPSHYNALMALRKQQLDTSMQDFFDLFHHRLLILLQRAWAKYRSDIYIQHNITQQIDQDKLSGFISGLTGLAHVRLATEAPLSIPPYQLLRYAGVLAQRVRPASQLESVVADYFNVDVKLVSYQGAWYRLAQSMQTRLAATKKKGHVHYTRLGQSAVLGSRVWDVQRKFRLRIGPLTATQFLSFLPGAVHWSKLMDFVRFYVGSEWCFDVQLVLKKEAIFCCQLCHQTPFSRLGFNTWVYSNTPQSDSDVVILTDTGASYGDD